MWQDRCRKERCVAAEMDPKMHKDMKKVNMIDDKWNGIWVRAQSF